MSWHGVRNVLCARLDSLGDVLMTTPALRALKQLRPAPKLTLWTSHAGAAVAPLVPEIDAVIEHAAPWMRSARAPDPRDDVALTERIEYARFDAAVIFTVRAQSPLPAAMLCHLAGIPRRLAHCRENPHHLLTHWVRDGDSERHLRHEVQRQLDLVRSVGAWSPDQRLSLRVTARAQQRARRLLHRSGVSTGRPWLAIHPGARAPSRRYPLEGFAEVARALAEEGRQIVLLGAREERELIARIQAEMKAPSHALTGHGIEELAALISLAPLLIANHGGPAQIAAAVQTPLVDLYALTHPQHAPWQVEHRMLSHDVPCRHCYRSICPEGHHACLQGVLPEQVVAAVHEICDHPE